MRGTAAGHCGFGHLALGECVPGKARRPAGIDLLERVRCESHRPRHLVERELAALHAEQAELERADDAARGRDRPRGSAPDAGPGPEPSSAARDLFAGSNRKPCWAKNGPPCGCSMEWKRSFCCASIDQRVGRFIGQFRGRRVDDRDDQSELRESLFERRFPLPPIDIGRNELVDVGRHARNAWPHTRSKGW